MPQKSIRLRLVFWFGFFLAMLIVGFGSAVYQLHKMVRLEDVDAELARRVDRVSHAFRRGDSDFHPPNEEEDRARGNRGAPPPNPHGRPPFHERAAIQLPDEIAREFGPGEYFAVWGRRENKVLAQSAPNAAGVPMPGNAAAGTLLRYRTRGFAREAYHFTEQGDCVLAGCDLRPEWARLRRFAWQIAALGGLLLLGGIGGGLLLSRLLFDSIRRIGDTARRISEGNLSERIPTGDMDRELGQLGDVLNTTFARLDAAFARQQQFTADAAHELRTPLAVILSETQTVLRRERSAGEYRDALGVCEKSAQDMRRLAESLLELARLDAGRAAGERTPTDLALVAQACAGQFQTLANQRGIRIRTDLKPAEIPGHPDQIGRVFKNLIANALDYTPPGGSIRISTAAEPGAVVAAVADTGEGIPPEDLPRIFDRFYQASRTRIPGHAGIGLAICKAIVEAHGGQIEATSTPGEGTTVTLRWPSSASQT